MASSLDKQKLFLSSPQFAVAGASTDQTKFGTKVLQWYLIRNKTAIPVHPKEDQLEGVKTVRDLTELPAPTETSVSIITPAKVTIELLKQAYELNVPAVWIQPGAADFTCVNYIKQNNMADRVIWSGECILRDGDEVLRSLL